MVLLIILGSLVLLLLLVEWRQHRKGRGHVRVTKDKLREVRGDAHRNTWGGGAGGLGGGGGVF